MRRIVTLSAILLLAAIPAQAQDGDAAEREVLQAVQKLFDAMRARDTVALGQVLDSGARLVTTRNRNGQPELEVTPVTDFIQVISTAAPGQLLDERITDPEVEIDDNLASVWVKYRFYVGERFSHCGVDAMHLAKTTSGWRIIGLADTQRPAAQCGN